MSSFCTTHIFFSKKFQHICVSLDVNFSESITNDVVSFEQLGPAFLACTTAFREEEQSRTVFRRWPEAGYCYKVKDILGKHSQIFSISEGNPKYFVDETKMSSDTYRNYPNYRDNVTPYHTCPNMEQPFRKHAYSNILTWLTTIKGKFSDKHF